MKLGFRPLNEKVGVEVAGIDLRLELSAAIIGELRASWLESTVLVVRGQCLTAHQLLRFTRYLGPTVSYTRAQNAMADHPEILLITNLKKPDGAPLGTPASGRYWHTDGHYLPVPPAASILYGVEVPETGGDTYFANCAAAYRALDPKVQSRIEGLRVVISQARARCFHYPERPPAPSEQAGKWLETTQPFVRTHPETGKRALYIGGGVPWHVQGLSEQESGELVTSLQEFSVRDEFIYRHQWAVGDLVLMDNRSSIHRGSEYDQVSGRRLLYRTTIEGDEPFF
jgi:alpha-ketoglutarate-dependent taurine dioxygenase